MQEYSDYNEYMRLAENHFNKGMELALKEEYEQAHKLFWESVSLYEAAANYARNNEDFSFTHVQTSEEEAERGKKIAQQCEKEISERRKQEDNRDLFF